MSSAIERVEEAGVAIVRVQGDLDVAGSPALYAALKELAARAGIQRVQLDLSRLGDLDSSGVVVVSLGEEAIRARGKELEIKGLSEVHRAAFELLPEPPTERRRARVPPLQALGEMARGGLAELAGFAELCMDTLWSALLWALRRLRLSRGALGEQIVRIGADAAAIVALLSLLIGLILAFQSAYQLRRFGAELYMADVVGLGMVREFGPMMTAIIVAGRTATGIAAELGTMAVREEVDALRTMGLWPVQALVLPRVLALTLVQPALTLLSILCGIAGGIGLASLLGLSVPAYYERMVDNVLTTDWVIGLTKSLLFAWIIGLVGCSAGLSTRGGASSVGRSATRAVVMSVFLIIVVDSVVTALSTVMRDV